MIRFRPGQMLYHLLGYSALVRWLGGRAFAWFWPRILFCGAVSIASVVVEMLAFLMIINVLHASEIAGVGSSNRISSLLHISGWHPFWRVVVPVIILSLAGLLTYVGRSAAITLHGLFTKRLSDEILQSLRERLDYFERREPFGGYRIPDIVLLLSNDCMSCGLALRMATYNFISVVYLLAGLGILAVLAPALLGLWCLSLLFVIPVVYLINLRGLRQARLLQTLAPQRRDAVLSEVHSLVGGGKAQEQRSDRINTTYLTTMDSRLRLIELSRFSLSLVFAIAVAAFLWIAQYPEAKSIMNLSYLLLLFLAFRYTFQGFQGLSVLVTTINRSLPQMMRVQDFSQRIEARAKRSETAVREIADAPADLRWRIENPDAGPSKGQFVLGQSFALVVPQQVGLDSIMQVYATLSGRASHAQFSKLAGPAPVWTTAGEVDPKSTASASSAETDWSSQVVEFEKAVRARRVAMGKPADPLDESRLTAFAIQVHRLSEHAATLAVLDGEELVRLALPTQRAILKKLSRHLTFVVTKRLGRVLSNHAYDGILVSTGVRIAAVLPGNKDVDDSMRQIAKNVFGSEKNDPSNRQRLIDEMDEVLM